MLAALYIIGKPLVRKLYGNTHQRHSGPYILRGTIKRLTDSLVAKAFNLHAQGRGFEHPPQHWRPSAKASQSLVASALGRQSMAALCQDTKQVS